MKRTQIYLSREQEMALKAMALTSGKRQSVLIREAVDLLLARSGANAQSWKVALGKTKGIWKDDGDAEQRLRAIRDEFDR